MPSFVRILHTSSNNDSPYSWRHAFYHVRTRLIGLGHFLLYGFRCSAGGKSWVSAKRSSPFVCLTTFFIYPVSFLLSYIFFARSRSFVCKNYGIFHWPCNSTNL